MTLSENSYRNDLIQVLTLNLPKPYKAINSVNIAVSKEDERFKVLKKLRREFDVIILDEAFIGKKKVNIDRIEYAIETKILGSPCSGISQAEDAFAAFPNLNITYATNFEESLYRRERNSPESSTPLNHRKLELVYEQISSVIVQDIKIHLNRSKGSTHVEISEKEAISILNECMDKIQKEMTELPDESKHKMTERTLIMWKKFNENDRDILELEYNIKRAAAYIIVDQFLFYHLLSTNSNYNLKPLKEIGDDEDDPDIFATKFFKRAIFETKDYRPIFEIDMLSLLPKKSNVVKAINEIIRTINDLGLEKINTDVLGKIFHSMIPLEIRHPIAAYYTGITGARLLANLAITRPDMIVGDLACGSGTLLMESYRRKKDLYKLKKPDMTDSDIHKKILFKEIYGNDITIFATHLTTMNLAIQNLNERIDKVNITSMDGLQIIPQKKFGTLQDFMDAIEVEATTVDGEKHSIIYPNFDCIIMNPPFSRQQDMDEDLVKNIDKITTEWFPVIKDKNTFIDKKMGLNGYFLIQGDRMLKSKGTIAMVLSASTFNTNYSIGILEYLKVKKYAIRYVLEILTKTSTFSEDCDFKEYLVVMVKNSQKNDDITKLISFKREFNTNEIPAIVKAIKKDEEYSGFILKKVKNDLLFEQKWSKLFNPTETSVELIFSSNKLELFLRKDENRVVKNSSGIELNEGFHGTYSNYLMIPPRNWALSRINDTTFEIRNNKIQESDEYSSCQFPASYLIRAIRSGKYANSLISEPTCYVLNLTHRLPRELDRFRRTYLNWAENRILAKIEQDRKKGRNRLDLITRPTADNSPWYSHAYDSNCQSKVGQLFVLEKVRPNKRRSLVTYSEEIVSVSNASFFIVSTPDAEFYASWMNTSFFIFNYFQNLRPTSSGRWQKKISDFADVFFPIYKEFKDTKDELIQLWKNLAIISNENLPFLSQQFGSDLVKYDGDGNEISRETFKPLSERIALDKAWMLALDIPEKNLDEIIESLYEWIRNFFQVRI